MDASVIDAAVVHIEPLFVDDGRALTPPAYKSENNGIFRYFLRPRAKQRLYFGEMITNNPPKRDYASFSLSESHKGEMIPFIRLASQKPLWQERSSADGSAMRTEYKNKEGDLQVVVEIATFAGQ